MMTPKHRDVFWCPHNNEPVIVTFRTVPNEPAAGERWEGAWCTGCNQPIDDNEGGHTFVVNIHKGWRDGANANVVEERDEARSIVHGLRAMHSSDLPSPSNPKTRWEDRADKALARWVAERRGA